MQAFASLQLSGVPGVQSPSTQVSTPLQTLPSEHVEPSRSGVWTQPLAGLHESAVQTLPSSQSSGSLVQEPFTQRSLMVQALVSAQSALVVQQPAIGIE